MSQKYTVNNINNAEICYSLLREKYPDNKIDIVFNFNTKEYTLSKSDESYIEDPQIPLNITIETVYGDSCIGSTGLLLRDPLTNLIHIETIQSIFDKNKIIKYSEFKMFDTTIRLEKEYSTTHFQTWTDIGWVNIKKVIRHKCNKKIYKILTHTGCVEVTEDHSLLNEVKEILKPSECCIGTKLLNSYPNTFNSIINSISKERAFIYGFFFGDGSTGKYNCPSGLKYSFALNNADITVLENLKILMKKEYPNNKIIIYDTLDSSGVYKLSVNNPKAFVEEYRPIFYDDDKYKKIPTIILNSNNEIIQSFFDGYWAADGCRKDKEQIGCTRFDNKGSIGSTGLYYLMKKLGYNVSLNTRTDKKNITRLTITKKKQRKITNAIKKIELLESTADYVYDLETDIGRYQAGIGDIITKNTDSIFLKYKFNRDDFRQNRIDTFKLAELCGNKITHELFNRNPICLEFEKVFQPFILLTKKRYIAKKYENMKDPFKLKCIDAKGIALTRRDFCKMVKNCYQEIIDIMLELGSDDAIDKSIEIFKNYVQKIDKYEINIDDLVLSAMLAASYKTKPVHVQLAEKLKERKEQVQTGDRVQYIFIETGDPKQAKSELGEDPEYARKHNLKYNRKCYLDQLSKTILGFFKVILKEDSDKLMNLIEYINVYIESYGAKPFKPSDFKIED